MKTVYVSTLAILLLAGCNDNKAGTPASDALDANSAMGPQVSNGSTGGNMGNAVGNMGGAMGNSMEGSMDGAPGTNRTTPTP